MPLKPRVKKPKGAVVRTDTLLRRSTVAFAKAKERLDEYELQIADQLAVQSQLQEELASAETACVFEAEKHLTEKKSSVVVGKVKLSRSAKNNRAVDPVKLLGAIPQLYKVDGLFRVVLGAYDKVVASGAYNAGKLSKPLSTEISFRYHVQLLEE